MNDVAPAPVEGALTVVAGVAPVARVVTAALLRAGHSVVGLLDPLDEPVPEPTELDASLAADLDAGRAAGRYLVTDDAGVAAGFTVALVTEPPGRRRRSPPPSATPPRWPPTCAGAAC